MLIVLVVVAVLAGGGWLMSVGLWRPPWVAEGIALRGEPHIGVVYKVQIYTHCGLRHVEFDGDTWAISGVLTDDNGANPPPGFGNPVDLGTVTLRSADTAVYLSMYGEQRQLTRGGGLPEVAACL